MGRTKIFLIRHSEQLKIKGENKTEDTEQLINEKIILSINGENLAQKMSQNEFLKGIDVLYSSNYVRAMSTAKYIAERNSIEINIDERLGERKLR